MVDVRQLALSYWPARAFSTAAELGVFDLLAAGPLDAAVISAKLGLRSPQVADLLDGLADLGILRREDDRYSLAAPIPDGVIDLASGYAAWADLPAALRDGAPPGPSMFEALDGERLTAFVEAMGRAAAPGHAALVERVAMRGDERVLDVGGGDGRLARALLERHPGLSLGVLDRPALEPFAVGVPFVAGDMFSPSPWPQCDVVVFSLVLLDWDRDAKRRLLAKAQDALAAGGRVVVLDKLGRRRPTNAVEAMHALHLLVTVGPAFPYTETELRTWLDEGFDAVTIEDVGDGFSLAIGTRR